MAMWRITRWYWYAIFWKQQVVSIDTFDLQHSGDSFFFKRSEVPNPTHRHIVPVFWGQWEMEPVATTRAHAESCEFEPQLGEVGHVACGCWREHERTVESSEIRSLFAHSSHGSTSNYLRWMILIYLYRHNIIIYKYNRHICIYIYIIYIYTHVTLSRKIV